MSRKTLRVDPADNVLVALERLKKGDVVELAGETCILKTDVPAKHKFIAVERMPGDEIVMYGTLVGRATTRICPGELITTENIKHAVAPYVNNAGAFRWNPPNIDRWQYRTFQGYHRGDGQVGVANYWIVVPLVFCQNRNIKMIRDAFEKELGYGQPDLYQRQVVAMAEQYRQGASPAEIKAGAFGSSGAAGLKQRLFPNIDGVKFLLHESGCGGTREDAANLCELIAGYINNPNVAGATVLSLGCQMSEIRMLREGIFRRNPAFDKPLLIYDQQASGPESAMMCRAIRDTFVELIKANELTRQPAPLSKLTLGVECGGSDGFSGISANPAIGHLSDLLVALGGKVILSEFPELCGVEQELLSRCRDTATADRFIQLMKNYAARAEAAGSGFDQNPSPGNIADGLITDAMKSAGAAKKGGTSPINGVLGYPEYVVEKGLNLMCTPGNDVESTTGMAGAGANVIIFSTGLGTPTGNPVVPVLKTATNSELARRMADIIDIDSGGIITAENTIQDIGEEMLEWVIRVASGEVLTKAQLLGQDDFIPWKRGVSL